MKPDNSNLHNLRVTENRKRDTVSILSIGAMLGLIAAFVMFLAVGLSTVYADDGDLDPTFDGDGKVTTDFGGTEQALDLAVQADGKIVVVGEALVNNAYDFAVARYNSDGSSDTGFDGDGKLTTDFGSTIEQANAVAIQPDGKILVGGYTGNGNSSNTYALARYNSDGSLDTSFDGDGKLTTSFGLGDARLEDLAIQADGKIVAAGSAGTGSAASFAAARYNLNGSLDTSFSGDGMVTTGFPQGGSADAVAIQADGKIVAAGLVAWPFDFAVLRYNSDGSLDSSFDGDGKVTTDFGGTDLAHAVALQADGMIVAAGTRGYNDFALARYNSDGSLDAGFDGDGRVLTSIGEAYEIAIQGDGKIVAAGKGFSTNFYDFTLARYNLDGSPDTSFGGDGIMYTDFGMNSLSYAIGLQGDGKLLVAGTAGANPALDFAVARYESSGGGLPTATVVPATATPCTAGQFSDVPSDHTFYPFVTCLVGRGVISGYSDCTFRPSNEITRGQIAKVVSNAAGYNDNVTGRQTYADVTSSNSFWTWIERLAVHNVMGGYNCGGANEPCDDQNRPYFRWGANTTRGQLSKIVSNAAGYDDNPPNQLFTDVPSSNTFYVWIQRLASRGVMSGYTCGGAGEPCDGQNRPYFRWGNNVTRGQASKIVANTFFPNCQSR
ncbi:MAG TPA: S-layer homology domain-containing protein [Chloroflexia bacterium]|nr:S-layer homology domain-containing protein [Chloroflexia bacterium]